MAAIIKKQRTIVEPVPFHTLWADSHMDFSLYFKGKDEQFKKILQGGNRFGKELKRKLASVNIEQLFISIKEKDHYYSYLDKTLTAAAKDTNIPLKAKALALYDGSVKVLENIFENPESGINIKQVKSLVSNTIDVVLSHEHSTKTLIDVSSFEYLTQTHSVDVAVYATAFAHHLGFGRGDLERVGFAAILHDIGKSKIDNALIYKNGELDAKEFEHMRRHTTFGYFLLKGQAETDRDILNGVRYHHERHDGSGYPERLRGRQIPLFAQIVALCDVYSALSTKRIYKDAYSALEALQVMQTEMALSFDKTLLAEFIAFLYPNIPDE